MIDPPVVRFISRNIFSCLKSLLGHKKESQLTLIFKKFKMIVIKGALLARGSVKIRGNIR